MESVDERDLTDNDTLPEHRVTAEDANEARKGSSARFRVVRDTAVRQLAFLVDSVEERDLTDNDTLPEHRAPRNTRTRRGRDRPRAFALSAIQQFGSWLFSWTQLKSGISRTTTHCQNIEHRGTRERGAEGIVRALSRCPRYSSSAVGLFPWTQLKTGISRTTTHCQNIESPRNTRTEARKGSSARFRVVRDIAVRQLAFFRGLSCRTGSHGRRQTSRTSSHRGRRERGAEGIVRALSRCPRFCSLAVAFFRGLSCRTGSHGQRHTARTSSHRGRRERGAEGIVRALSR